MGKNNNTNASTVELVEATIFDQLGIVPPRTVKVREMAEHVLTKTVQYAKQNVSCSTGTATFLIDTLNIEGITAEQLSNRINALGGVKLEISFSVITTASDLSNTTGMTDLYSYDADKSLYVPTLGGTVNPDQLVNWSRNTRAAAASLFGTYADYFRLGGTVGSVTLVENVVPVKDATIK